MRIIVHSYVWYIAMWC